MELWFGGCDRVSELYPKTSWGTSYLSVVVRDGLDILDVLWGNLNTVLLTYLEVLLEHILDWLFIDLFIDICIIKIWIDQNKWVHVQCQKVPVK